MTDILAYTLRLSPAQVHALRAGDDRYDMSRLAMRDGVLYAPLRAHGVWGAIKRFLFGAETEAINP